MVTTNLNDLFDGMEPEEGNKLDKKIQIEDDKELKEVIENYTKFQERNELYLTVFGEPNPFFSTISKIESKLITLFSVYLNQIQNETSHIPNIKGIYLSFLINKSPDQDHLIYSNVTGEPINAIGYKNEGKTISVKGNCGNNIGFEMEKGVINVYGNSEHNTGFSLRDGVINIFGNAGDSVGSFICGGTINIQGEISSISKMIEGGNIYHKGRLIVRDGELIDKSYEIK